MRLTQRRKEPMQFRFFASLRLCVRFFGGSRWTSKFLNLAKASMRPS
jgi:hypothetical protein